MLARIPPFQKPSDENALSLAGESASRIVDHKRDLKDLRLAIPEAGLVGVGKPSVRNLFMAVGNILEAHKSRFANDFNPAKYYDPSLIQPFFAEQSEPVSVSKQHFKAIFGEDAVWFKDSEFCPKLEKRAKDFGDQIYGTTPAAEGSAILEIARAIKPRTILVIGTHLGIQSADLLENCPDHTLVFSLDIKPSWVGRSISLDATNLSYLEKAKITDADIGKVIKDLPQELQDRHFQIFADSKFALRPIDGLLKDLTECFDLIVVDGNHKFDAAVYDIVNSFRFVSKGGVVVVDDYQKPPRLLGVETAVNIAATLVKGGNGGKLDQVLYAALGRALMPTDLRGYQSWWINGFDDNATPKAQPTNLAFFTRPVD